MSSQVHARADEKHFEIIGPTFSNTIAEFRKLFSSVGIALIFRKLADFFYLQKFLVPVITETFCCNIFESFCKGGKPKILQQVVCKLVSIGLY